MPQWTIPHDDNHRFLKWGPRDENFKAWCDFFTAKGVDYEVGGGEDSWTIYKHQLYVDIGKLRVNRCCPESNEL
jgi:hypothetical protein